MYNLLYQLSAPGSHFCHCFHVLVVEVGSQFYYIFCQVQWYHSVADTASHLFDKLRGHVGEATETTAALLHLRLEVELHGDLGRLLHDRVLVSAAGSAAIGRLGVEELDAVVVWLAFPVAVSWQRVRSRGENGMAPLRLTLLASPMARLIKSFLPPLPSSLPPEVNFLRACIAAAVPMALTLLLLSPLL